MDIQPVLVSYHTPRWIRVAIRSYLAHCPEKQILVIDNNPEEGEKEWGPLVAEERRWLRQNPAAQLVKNPGERQHGTAVDLAMRWCRDNGVAALLHFEPDCVITKRAWYDGLLDALMAGASMAGTTRLPWGPIHLTPSVWRTNVAWPGFDVQRMAGDEKHPRFPELYDPQTRLRTSRACTRSFAENFWDTGEKAWFAAAVRDKACLVTGADVSGFRHYWRGCRERTNHPDLDSTLAGLARY